MRVSPRGSFAFLCIVSGNANRTLIVTDLARHPIELLPVCKETGISQPLRVSQCRSDRGATSFLVSRSLYCGGNDSHPPPSALYKAIRFVVTAVWLCAKRSSFP